jgi:translation initiation factor 1 (eIF-1/SUI1)
MDLEEDELKEHSKKFKKTHGCNGTITKDKETNEFILQFQGNHIETIKEYLVANGIKESSIYIKGE